MSSLLIPGDAVLSAWTAFSEARQWAGLSDAEWAELASDLGEESLDSLVVVAALPPAAFQATVGRVGTPVTHARLALAVNAVRARFGLPAADLFGSSPSTVPVGPAVAAVAGEPRAPVGGLKVRLSQVVDQGSDQEVVMLSPDRLLKARRAYHELYGEPPLPAHDPTDAQLTGLAYKVENGAAPYVDFGVWGPHGARLERRLRFTSFVQAPGGTYRTVELPGAECLDTWRACWAVYRTAAVMLNIALPGVLDRYEALFVERCQRYPGSWHLSAQADIRCRSEFMILEKRLQEEFHVTHAAMSSYNPGMPWNSVLKSAASDTEFWDRELKEPALLYTRGPRPNTGSGGSGLAGLPPAPPPPAAGDQGPGRRVKKKAKPQRGQANPSTEARRADGRFFRDRHGTDLCFTWNRAEGACGKVCSAGRSHACEWCRQPHRAVACPQHPGWAPTAGPKGSGKGAPHS